jgi:hypothetical protein
MPESYEEKRARRAGRAAANERDPEKLKQWYELAGEAAEDPDKQIQETARIINSAEKPKTPKPTGGGGGEFDETVATPEPGTVIGKEQDRHLRPIIHRGLGAAGHRRIYGVTEATRAAQEQGRSTPTEDEIEQHAKSWDVMPNDSKYHWQQSPHGKAATEQAIAEYTRNNAPSAKRLTATASQNQSRKRKVEVVGAAFSTPEQAQAFKKNDRLLDEDGNDETNWRKPFSLANITGQQKIAELSPTKAVEGVALDTDSSHLEALDSHLNELSSRPSASAPSTLQGNQFNNKEGLLTAAKQAMARSAMAHALGMKDAAVRHFSDAVNHAGNLAKAIHGVNSDPISDWDKQEDILHNYKSRPWNQGGRRY